MTEIDEVVAAIVELSKKPHTVEFWGREEGGSWRQFAITIEQGKCSYFVQGVPISLAEMQETDLQVFATLHATFPVATQVLAR